MKELKKILNKSSNFIYKILVKISNFIKKENNTLLIKSIIKIAILVLIYFILGLIADGIINVGSYIIYQVGTTARGILSSIWATVVNFTYFLFIIVSLYKLAEMAEEDESFFTLYKNSKKDKEVKEKIFITIESVVKVLGTIIMIPLFVVDIALLFALGIMVGYLKQGIYLYSLFVAVIGLILFFTSVIFLIKTLLSSSKSNSKIYLYTIILSGLLLAGSSVSILFEVSSYKNVDTLTTDFTKSTMVYEYKLNKDKDYIITNDNSDTNMTFVVDDDMGSYMQVSIMHYETNEVKTSLKEGNDKVTISYDEELNLEIKDIENIFNLGVSCVKEKTLYDYTLLKYAEIEIRVSRDYAKNIKFVDSNGKEYNPYERNN